jgi:electron transfer flavoprotein alpha subunit
VIAVVPVRDGVLPAGGAETVAEAGGRVVLVGDGTTAAAIALTGASSSAVLVEAGPFAPARWAAGLAPTLEPEAVVVLPASPDGRDLAPRLAAELGRPLHAGAIAVTEHRVDVARHGGRAIERIDVTGAFVATLQPGARDTGGVAPSDAVAPPTVRRIQLAATEAAADAEVLGVSAPEAATVDLAEAPRIVAGGGGLDGPERLVQLAAVARALDASVGASRVVTDRGWLGYDRQIGTTGVAVDPELYIALAVSGAVQHVNGIGTPDHIVAVNTDPHCPMMAMAHLAIVCDANQLLDELESRLGTASEPAHG